MPSTTVQCKSKTASEQKSNQFVIKSHKEVHGKKDMDRYIKRRVNQLHNKFDELFLELSQSEINDKNDRVSQVSLDNKEDEKEFQMKLNIKEYQPCTVELAINENGKRILIGKKESNDDISNKWFTEILDIPESVNVERISLTQEDNGYLVIKAPFRRLNQKNDMKWAYSQMGGFSMKLNIRHCQPSDVDIVVDTNNKLIVKERRQVNSDAFTEVFDLPANIDDEEISVTQDKDGFLIIKALSLNQEQECKVNLTGKTMNVLYPSFDSFDLYQSNSNHLMQLFDDFYAPMVKSADRKN